MNYMNKEYQQDRSNVVRNLSINTAILQENLNANEGAVVYTFQDQDITINQTVLELMCGEIEAICKESIADNWYPIFISGIKEAIVKARE